MRPPNQNRALPLSFRLVATYTLLVAATLSVVAALATDRTRYYLARELDARLAAVVRSFEKGPARRVEKAEQLAPEATKWLAVLALSEDQVAAVRTADGTALYSSTQGRNLLRGSRGGVDLLSFESRRWRWWELDGPGGPVRVITVPLVLENRQVGTLVVAASRQTARQTVSALLTGIGWSSGIGLVFATLLGLAAVRRTLGPLAEMAKDVEAIQATDDLSIRVRQEGPDDEVGRLAEAFDRMLARLEEAFRSQQRFLSDASHELRTPLTVARGQLELVQQEIRSVDARNRVAIAVEELDRMGGIVEDLLLLARLDEGMHLAAEAVEVELVLREALLRAMLLARREVTVDAEPGLYALADPDRLLQVLTNLVTNAVYHAGKGAHIWLTARRDGPRVLMQVSDSGPGIAPEELPYVFDRLYRGSAARTGISAGAGLGLAIAASLVKAMGGDIGVRSNPGSGTTFHLSLPSAGPPTRALLPPSSSTAIDRPARLG